MKPEWRRYAPFGLYLAIAAALVAGILYAIQREWNLTLQISLALIVIGLAVFVILDPDRIRRALSGRQARYGSNALILTIAFITILVVLNYVVYQNSQRWDLTEDKSFTLSQETLDVLERLPGPVLVQAFFTPERDPSQAQGLLDQYKFHADGKFNYEFIDPVVDMVAAEQAGITRDGSVVLVLDENKQIVDSVSEANLTSALLRLIDPTERKVYFLTGHGEYSPESTGDTSYSIAKRVLESKNYTVGMLNLLAENMVPDDAKAIVIAGPKQPVSSAEVEILDGYLANGGALIVMEEPVVLMEMGDGSDPLVDYLSGNWGITLGLDFVIDQSSNQPTFAIGAQWGNHTITQPLLGFASVMPSARSASTGESSLGASVVTLASTAQNAWAETDLEALLAQASVEPTEGVDIIGSVPLAALAESFETGGKVVVFGDADFGTDAFFQAYANGDLFINSVDWAVGAEELISLTPKETTQRTVIPPQKYVINLIMLITVIVLPSLALLAGVWVWVQRRRRG